MPSTLVMIILCMPWQGSGSSSEINNDITKVCQTVYQVYALMWERVWKIRRSSILKFISEVVISRLRRQSDSAPRDLYPYLPEHRILLIAKHNEILDGEIKNTKRPLRIGF